MTGVRWASPGERSRDKTPSPVLKEATRQLERYFSRKLKRFDLPLAARVRALGGGAAPPSSGEAPPPAPDARPDLAAAQRRDAPVLKMSVPPAYEAVVRAAFAHQGTEAPP